MLEHSHFFKMDLIFCPVGSLSSRHSDFVFCWPVITVQYEVL